MTPSTHATEFVAATSEKFTAELNERFMNKYSGGRWVVEMSIAPGRRFDKIIIRTGIDYVNGGSVHCFIERATGHVYKAEGWKAPAKGVRYASVADAVAVADVHGGYLYR